MVEQAYNLAPGRQRPEDQELKSLSLDTEPLTDQPLLHETLFQKKKDEENFTILIQSNFYVLLPKGC